MRGKVASRKLWIAAAAILLILSVLATACSNNELSEPANGGLENKSNNANEQNEVTGGQPAEKVKIKGIIHASWVKDGLKAVIAAASEKIGVELELDQVAEGEAGDKIIQTRFATRELPDLAFFYMGPTNIVKLGDPEENFVPQDDQPWIANLDKEAWKGIMDYNGKYYGAPFSGGSVGSMIYNKKVFEELKLEIPKTYTEFLQVAEKLKAAGKIPVYISGKDAWTLQIIPFNIGTTLDAKALYEKINVNQAKVTEDKDTKHGLEIMLDLKEKGLINPTFLSDTYATAQKALVDGEAGMYPMATWVMAEIINNYPDRVNDLGAFMIPADDSGKISTMMFSPSMVYVVKGKNQEAAQKWVNFFASPEGQDAYFAVEGGIPAVKGVTKTQLTPAEVEAKKFVDDGLVVPSNGAKYGTGDFAALIQDMMAGGKSPDQVLEAMHTEFVKNAKAAGDPNF